MRLAEYTTEYTNSVSADYNRELSKTAIEIIRPKVIEMSTCKMN